MLDTTFLVDAERAAAELDAIIADDDDVAIAAVTVAELLVGVALARGKQRRGRRQAFVDTVIEAVPVLPYDVRVARAHANLLASVRGSGRPRGAHDLIIAATAVASGRIVLTADPTGFQDLPGLDVRKHGTEA